MRNYQEVSDVVHNLVKYNQKRYGADYTIGYLTSSLILTILRLNDDIRELQLADYRGRVDDLDKSEVCPTCGEEVKDSTEQCPECQQEKAEMREER